ncbi:MAG: hypothetical protein R3309_13830, partial [Reinekea sp.]|nr:hypothetical protein [Reinekea sp.]
VFIGIGYLGIFAKEQAILIGILVLVIDATVFSSPRYSRLNRAWKVLVLVLPFALLVLYLLFAGRIFGAFGNRDFTLSDRLLTQSVIIFDYLGKILAPSNARINLYNDGYPFKEVVSNWAITAPAILAIAASIALSIRYRTKAPLITFGVLFFFSGHLLESTALPLELYFEHRNYVPSIGLVIALVGGVGFFAINLRKRSQLVGTLTLVASFLWIGWLSLVTSYEARTWGNPRDFAIAALTERPDSFRARQEMAAYFLASEDYYGAANLLYSIDSDFGVYAGTYAQLLMLKCFESEMPLPPQDELLQIFQTAPFDRGVGVALNDLRKLKNDDACEAVSNEQLLAVSAALLSNPTYRNRRNFYALRAFLLADQGRWEDAAQTLEAIPRKKLAVSELILIARFYNYAGQKERALAALDRAKGAAGGVLDQMVYDAYIERLRTLIVNKNNRPEPSRSSEPNG